MYAPLLLCAGRLCARRLHRGTLPSTRARHISSDLKALANRNMVVIKPIQLLQCLNRCPIRTGDLEQRVALLHNVRIGLCPGRLRKGTHTGDNQS